MITRSVGVGTRTSTPANRTVSSSNGVYTYCRCDLLRLSDAYGVSLAETVLAALETRQALSDRAFAVYATAKYLYLHAVAAAARLPSEFIASMLTADRLRAPRFAKWFIYDQR